MKACVLATPAPVESNPLQSEEVAQPEPGADELLIRVHACGVCRTDLHVVEGELKPKKRRIIPGHQVVGRIEHAGDRAKRFPLGSRVGVPWLRRTDETCEYCRSGRENLCPNASFTGWSVDGGYAEYLVAPEAFVYALPDNFADLHAAPLLCAGIIGFRSLRLAALSAGARLGIYGFGAAGHVAIQAALHWGMDVYVMTRDEGHRKLAAELGASWVGGTEEPPPQALDAALIFAPAGEIVIAALKAVRRGGSVVCGGIHMSDIPSFPYDLLYGEKLIRSVANNTRRDGEDFLKIAAEIPIHTETQVFPLSEANAVLQALKNDAIRGAAVLQVEGRA